MTNAPFSVFPLSGLRCSSALFQPKGFFHRAHQLIGTGRAAPAAVVPLQNADCLIGFLSLQQLADGVEVAVAAPDEMNIMELSVLQAKADLAGANALGLISIGIHYDMKSTGIVRKVDELGRIVLPIEMRRTLGVDNSDPIEMFLDGKNIILRKYAPGCVFCGNPKENSEYTGKRVCRDCIRGM
jgi:transcriptional pleiotropic regulator of transition state genes